MIIQNLKMRERNISDMLCHTVRRELGELETTEQQLMKWVYPDKVSDFGLEERQYLVLHVSVQTFLLPICCISSASFVIS